MKIQNELPKILIIDDQFGRCGLGNRFRKFVGEEVFSGYMADRINLCSNYGIRDVSADIPDFKIKDPIASGIFCPAQTWDKDNNRITNDLNLAYKFIDLGWPFKDGSRWSLILLDLRFVYGNLNQFGDPQEGDLFGIDVLLPEIRKKYGDDLPIIILSSTSKEENNPKIRRLGALDFIHRIPDAGDVLDKSRGTLRNALFFHGLNFDYSRFIVGNSLPVLKMLRQARRGARGAHTILLCGEIGSGKSLLARYIHQVSERKEFPFEIFNASNRNSHLQSDELFGHWKGAFTDAHTSSPGLWERANGGTVFIDEIADLDHSVQQKLMQPIEEKTVSRMGHSPKDTKKNIQIDVLTLLATNKNLSLLKDKGQIKSDFLNRINAFSIEIPPLRERKEDIPLLVSHLQNKIAPWWRGRFLEEAISKLTEYDWREGNIREIRNVMEKAIIENPDQDITEKDILLPYSYKKTGIEDELIDNQNLLLSEFLISLSESPDEFTMEEIIQIKEKYFGVFPKHIASLFNWALELNKSGDKINLTATAKFLLGKDCMTTMEAKQFVKKLLSLDTKGRSVALEFQKLHKKGKNGTLNLIVKQIIDKERNSSK